MKSTKINSCLLIISYFLLFYNSGFIKETFADPLAPFAPAFGGFLIEDNSTYSMSNAYVLIEIDATNPSSHFELDFMGNYTIFNPNNSTNVTIAAPFSPEMFGMNHTTINDILYENGSFTGPVQIEMPEVISNCTIKINDSIIPYEIFVYSPERDFPWTVLHMIGLLCNITLPKNSSVVLEYSFNTYLATPSHYDGYYIEFMYFVGSSQTWDGNITETVEFRVKGAQPDRAYSWRMEPDYTYGKDCIISNIEDGRSYLWEWKDVRIYEDYTVLWYDNDFRGFGNSSVPLGNFFLISTIIGFAIMITLQKIRLGSKNLKIKR